MMERNVLHISYANEITLISLTLSGGNAVSQVLSAFAERDINVDMISQTAPQGGEVRFSFTLSDRDLGAALTTLGQMSGERRLSPEILPGNSKIAFYDPNMVRTPGAAARVLSLLAGANIPIMLITTSDVDISILVSSHDVDDALHLLDAAYAATPVEVEF